MIKNAVVIISAVVKRVAIVVMFVRITVTPGAVEIVKVLAVVIVQVIIVVVHALAIVVIILVVDLITDVLKMLHQQHVLLLVLVIINVIVNQDIKLGLAHANLEM